MTAEERATHAMSQLGDPRTSDVVLLRSVVHNWLVSVLRLAIAEEREACAKVADALNNYETAIREGYGYGGWQKVAGKIAAAIRARTP